jgi:hypothetical protein
MAIAVVIDVPDRTADQHDALVDAMGLTDQPASAVPGMIFHAAGPTASGWGRPSRRSAGWRRRRSRSCRCTRCSASRCASSTPAVPKTVVFATASARTA